MPKATERALPARLPVVVIDDEQDLLDIMTILFNKSGIPVKAYPAPPSVDEIAALEPAVVITDLLLKGQRGTDVCGALKADPRTAEIPVVLMSAHTPADVEKAATACRADGFMVKPFDIQDFLKMARTWRAKATLRADR